MTRRRGTCRLCPRPHKAKGLCGTHYRRLTRTGDPMTAVMGQPRKHAPTCKEADCDRPTLGGAHGWCRLHYRRWWQYGDPQKVLRVNVPKGARCSVPDCDRPMVGKGLCNTHRARVYVYGDPVPEVPILGPQDTSKGLIKAALAARAG